MVQRPSRTAPILAGLLSVSMALSGCNWISVALLVSRRFAPALGKGDQKRLQRHSSRKLAKLWGGFSEREIKVFLTGSADGKRKRSGKKRRRMPSPSLVSIKIKGKRAVLIARAGKHRYRFECVKQDGSWKVDDLTFPRRGRKTRLQRLLRLLLGARALQKGLETGSRTALVRASTRAFARQTWDRLSDDELSTFAKTASPTRIRRRTRRRKVPRINASITKRGGVVTVSGGSLPARVTLVEKQGTFRVERASLKLGGGWHSLAEITEYALPALRLLRWVTQTLQTGRQVPTDAELTDLISRLKGALSTSLWRQAFSWLTKDDLRLLPWRTVARALAPAPRAPRTPRTAKKRTRRVSFKASAITRFERRGKRLDIALKIKKTRVAIVLKKEQGHWRLHHASVKRGRFDVRLVDLLGSLAPVVRLTALVGRLRPQLVKGGSDSRQALTQLLGAVKAASSKDLNAKLWSRIPPALIQRLPLGALPQAIRRLFPTPGGTAARKGAGKNRGPRHLPPIQLVDVTQTANRVTIALKAGGNPIQVVLVREQTGWKIDDVRIPLAGAQRSLKIVLGMIVPAAALADAILTGKTASLKDAFSAPLRRSIIAPLQRMLGYRLPALLRLVGQLGMPKPKRAPPRGRPRAPPRRPASAPGLKLTRFQIKNRCRKAHIDLRLGGKSTVAVTLVRDGEQIWRIDDVAFPLGSRTVRLRRVGPVMVPLLGFTVSLISGNLRGVRLASSYAFNKSVWRKMTRRKFRSLVKTIASQAPTIPGVTPPRRRKGPRARPKPRRRKQPKPRLVALRIQDKARWPWAQVTVDVGGKRIRTSLIRQKGQWRVHDVELSLRGMTLSIRKLLSLGIF